MKPWTKAVAGRLVDVVGRADLLDLALVHDDDAVGDFQRLLLVVGDEDRGDVDLVMQRAQPFAQLFPHLRIERAEGLVEQQDARLDRERAGQRDALALAAGELARIAVGKPVELHEIEQLLDPRADRRLVLPDRARLHAQAEGDVLEHAHVAEQRVVLEHEADVTFARALRQRVLAVEGDFAGIRPVEAGDDPQQRGLAGAGGAEQREQLAVIDLEVDTVERCKAAELLDEIFDFNGH